MGSVICHKAMNALLTGSISVDAVVWMMLVLLNGDYRIAEESHNNDVGYLANRTLCSAEGVNSETNVDIWVKYAMIRYKINNNGTLSENLHNKVEKYDSQATTEKYQYMR